MAARVLYPYASTQSDELILRKNEVVEILEKTEEDWWRCRNTSGDEGMAPLNYLEILSLPPGWVATTDEASGDEYYFNASTGMVCVCFPSPITLHCIHGTLFYCSTGGMPHSTSTTGQIFFCMHISSQSHALRYQQCIAYLFPLSPSRSPSLLLCNYMYIYIGVTQWEFPLATPLPSPSPSPSASPQKHQQQQQKKLSLEDEAVRKGSTAVKSNSEVKSKIQNQTASGSSAGLPRGWAAFSDQASGDEYYYHAASGRFGYLCVSVSVCLSLCICVSDGVGVSVCLCHQVLCLLLLLLLL